MIDHLFLDTSHLGKAPRKNVGRLAASGKPPMPHQSSQSNVWRVQGGAPVRVQAFSW